MVSVVMPCNKCVRAYNHKWPRRAVKTGFIMVSNRWQSMKAINALSHEFINKWVYNGNERESSLWEKIGYHSPDVYMEICWNSFSESFYSIIPSTPHDRHSIPRGTALASSFQPSVLLPDWRRRQYCASISGSNIFAFYVYEWNTCIFPVCWIK